MANTVVNGSTVGDDMANVEVQGLAQQILRPSKRGASKSDSREIIWTFGKSWRRQPTETILVTSRSADRQSDKFIVDLQPASCALARAFPLLSKSSTR